MPGLVKSANCAGGIVRRGLVGPKIVVSTFPEGCAVHLDATDDSTITHASNAVSAWRSKAGGRHSFDQSTAGAKPTRATGAMLKGLQHIHFDGGDILTYLAGIAVGQLGEVWTVVDLDSVSVAPRAIYSQIPGGSVDYVVCYAVQNGAASSRAGLATYAASPNVLRTTRDQTSNNTIILRQGSDGSAYIHETGGAADTLQVIGGGANNGTWFGDYGVMNSSNIGGHLASGIATQQLLGQMGEQFVIDGRNLADNERTALLAYLTGKWV